MENDLTAVRTQNALDLQHEFSFKLERRGGERKILGARDQGFSSLKSLRN